MRENDYDGLDELDYAEDYPDHDPDYIDDCGDAEYERFMETYHDLVVE